VRCLPGGIGDDVAARFFEAAIIRVGDPLGRKFRVRFCIEVFCRVRAADPPAPLPPFTWWKIEIP